MGPPHAGGKNLLPSVCAIRPAASRRMQKDSVINPIRGTQSISSVVKAQSMLCCSI
jgi:hypothetical protein